MKVCHPPLAFIMLGYCASSQEVASQTSVKVPSGHGKLCHLSADCVALYCAILRSNTASSSPMRTSWICTAQITVSSAVVTVPQSSQHTHCEHRGEYLLHKVAVGLSGAPTHTSHDVKQSVHGCLPNTRVDCCNVYRPCNGPLTTVGWILLSLKHFTTARSPAVPQMTTIVALILDLARPTVLAYQQLVLKPTPLLTLAWLIANPILTHTTCGQMHATTTSWTSAPAQQRHDINNRKQRHRASVHQCTCDRVGRHELTRFAPLSGRDDLQPRHRNKQHDPEGRTSLELVVVSSSSLVLVFAPAPATLRAHWLSCMFCLFLRPRAPLLRVIVAMDVVPLHSFVWLERIRAPLASSGLHTDNRSKLCVTDSKHSVPRHTRAPISQCCRLTLFVVTVAICLLVA